jgi:phosphoglycerate kinase
MFSEVISKSNTIIWNGPVGMFEMDKYAKGTIGLCEALKKNNGINNLKGTIMKLKYILI